MRYKRVLLLYKRSAYNIYFQGRPKPFGKHRSNLIKKEVERFKHAHDAHYKTLRKVSKALLSHGVRYDECYRGRNVNFRKYDLIITIGGDGTFLEAARKIKDQVMLGVNSAPDHSVGRFCIASAANIDSIIKKIIAGRTKIAYFHRLRVNFKGSKKYLDALNDILICHQNPAMLCRYFLKVKGLREEQRSSGIWVATPAGSSGAIRSAGGKLLPPYGKSVQYLPRELYSGKNGPYRHKGGVLSSRQSLSITSLMRRGAIYLDGAHQKEPFGYGTTIKISMSPHPVRTVKL